MMICHGCKGKIDSGTDYTVLELQATLWRHQGDGTIVRRLLTQSGSFCSSLCASAYLQLHEPIGPNGDFERDSRPRQLASFPGFAPGLGRETVGRRAVHPER